MTRSPQPIHCIGDSHAAFFSGLDEMQPIWPRRSSDTLPFFRSYRLGPVLAYNLGTPGTRSGGHEKLRQVLALLPRGATILLCFGEIDCRAHLLRQARLQQREPAEVVGECADRYACVIAQLISEGYRVLVWNAVASTVLADNRDPDFPVFGSCVERNAVTRLFNDAMAQRCQRLGAAFVTIFDRLVERDGRTAMRF
jgi:hypothetical protein